MQDLRAGYALPSAPIVAQRCAVVRVLDCLCNPATHLTYGLAYVGRGLWSNGTSSYSRMGGIRRCASRASLSSLERETIIRKEGQRLIIEPAPPKSLLAVLATLPTLEEEFPPIEDLPAEAVAL
jgi:virulence-associated protein VagC